MSLHVQGTGHTRAVSPTPPGPSGHFPPYSTNTETTSLPVHATQTVLLLPCAECFSAVCRLQCVGCHSAVCITTNRTTYSALPTLLGWVGPGRARVISPHKCTGYCKQPRGGVSRPTSEMQSTACQSGNTNARVVTPLSTDTI